MKARHFLRAATVSVAALAAGPALAEYGAIAFSPGTGSHGYSYGYYSEGEAGGAALANCASFAADCQVLFYFYNACGALAVGDNLGYGYAWDEDQYSAESAAMASCNANDSGCQVVRWVCS